METCQKCGAGCEFGRVGGGNWEWNCGTWRGPEGDIHQSSECLRNQLAATEHRAAEWQRVAELYQVADKRVAQLEDAYGGVPKEEFRGVLSRYAEAAEARRALADAPADGDDRGAAQRCCAACGSTDLRTLTLARQRICQDCGETRIEETEPVGGERGEGLNRSHAAEIVRGEQNAALIQGRMESAMLLGHVAELLEGDERGERGEDAG